MTKTKKFLVAGLCCLATALAGIAVGISAQASPETIYEYGLVCRSYKTESKNCTVTGPDGNAISVRNNQYFVPDKAGVYTIVYSDKTVLLTIREYAKSPEYVLDGEYAEIYSVGETLVIPELTTINPENYTIVDEYKIQVLCGDSLVYTTKENGDTFLLSSAGDYQVVYNYENVYGVDAQKIYEFSVDANAVLVMPKYESSVRLGGKINLSEIYGYYNGEKHPASFSVVTPSKTKEVEGTLVFDEKGTYTLTATVTIDGNVLSKTATFEVYADLGNLFTGINIDSFESDAPLQAYTNVARGQKGIKIITDTLGAKVYYNTPIDLNGLTKNDNLIEFEILSSEWAYMSSITIRLTDVYDSSNWLAITWRDCSHGSVPVQKGVHSYSYLSCSNGFAGSSYNSTPDAMRFGTGSSACMVNYTSCFHGQYKMQGFWNTMLGTFNCQFNYETKEFYTYDDKYLRQRRMADLDSVGLMGNYAWEGFTTGEAYLSIEFDGVVGEQSGINVLQIAGKNLSSDSMKLAPIGDIRMDTDMEYIQNGLPQGAVGYPYTIPAPVTSNLIRDQFEVETKLYKMNGEKATDITSTIVDGAFTPTETGTYRITYYSNDAHGFLSEKSYEFVVGENPAEITVEQVTYPTPVMMSWFMLPAYSYSGGRGKLTSSYKVTVDGEEQDAENNRIYIDRNCQIQVAFTVTDYIGYSKTVTETYTVDYDKYLFIKALPTALRAGSTVFLAEFSAYDFNFSANEDGYLLDKQIYIDGELYDDTKGYVVPTNKNSVTIEYRGVNKNDSSDYIAESYTLPVVTVADKMDMTGYFLAGDGASVTSSATSVVLNFEKDGDVAFVNPVAADGLQLAFKINTSSAEKVVVVLEDYEDANTKIRLEIAPYEGSKSALYINGTLSGYVTGTFTGVSYQLSFNNQKGLLYDAGKVLCAVTNSENGNVFEGFTGCVRLTFGLSGVTQKSGLEIETIGNQSFGLESYMKGDIVAPQFVFDGDIEAKTVSVGYQLVTATAYGVDVLQGKASVKLTVVSPSGTTILNNATATQAYTLTLEEYGYYRLLYKTTDGNKSTTKEVRYYVLDEIAPEINIIESVPTVAKVGETISLPKASASDNVKVDMQAIYVITPEGRRIVVVMSDLASVDASYCFEMKGTYKFVYCVYDKDYNVTRKTFIVAVTE